MLRWIVAIVLIAHGLGHAMGFLASWTTIQSGLTAGNWVFSNDITMDSAIGRVFGLIWLLALAGTTAAGVGLLLRQDWWQPVAIVSAVVSLVAILPWVSVMPIFSAIGAVAVDVVILVVLLTPWREKLLEPLG